MTRFRYPTRVVMRDYLLSGVGLVIFLPPLALINLPTVTVVVFSALGGLFLIFALQVYRRHRTRVELYEDRLYVAPGGKELRWRGLDKLVLSYFTVRRDGERGWMELKLAAGPRVLRMDSRLEGFSEIAASAARAARQNGLELDPATVANLAALGIEAADRDGSVDHRR